MTIPWYQKFKIGDVIISKRGSKPATGLKEFNTVVTLNSVLTLDYGKNCN